MSGDVKPPWDFSEARQLLNSFTYPQHEDLLHDPGVDSELPRPAEKAIATSKDKKNGTLGDFEKIFGALIATNVNNPEPAAYTSDGAATVRTETKRVTWDETEPSTSSDGLKIIQRRQRNRPKIEASSPRAIPVETPTNKKTKKNRPSKKDRDKAKRKVARKAASEVESEGEIRSPSKRSPAQKASVRQSRRIAAQAARPSTAPTAQTSLQESLLQIYQARLPAHVTQPWHFSTNSPQSVNQPPTSPNGFQPSPALLLPNTFNWQPAMVEPRPQDKSDRDFQLRLRLIHCFPEDKKWLMAAVPFADHFHTPQETGIHVFVDFSNISIGYMQKVIQLRHEAHRRGEYLRMSQRLSFDSLVLLLERGRPVAKRVLAGSTPLDPAIAKAAAIGYDVKILQKVYKDDTVTERDRRAAALLSSPSPHELAQSSAGVTTTQTMALQTTSSSSPSPYSQPPSTPPSSLHPSPSHITPATGTANGRWVEQAVDEILHMTIYESVIDAETPSTIVLATGDGAQAEFSDGFMRTVERALNRGWRVELVAWKKAMNGSWKSGEWAGKWGDRFRILELDGWERWIEDVRV